MQSNAGKEDSESGGQSLGFVQRFFSFFMGGGDPEAEKKKILRNIAKDLGKTRYKFYKPKSEEALPGLGKLFYDVYKVIAGAQVLLANAENSGSMKSFIIERFIGAEQLELLNEISEDSIRKRSQTVPGQELARQLKDELVSFFSVFDSDKVREIDDIYSQLISFLHFANFDYYFVLKKFDSSVSERNFAYHPKFETIRSEYVTDDIKDFLETLLPLNLEADWKRFFTILREYKDVDIVPLDQWLKLVQYLKEVRSSQILVNIVQYVGKDPFWQPISRNVSEHVVESYLQKIKTQTEVIIQKIAQEKRNSKIDELAKQLFGTTTILRMKNYTEKANLVFAKKMVGGFIHVVGINYLKAFLLDFFKKDIREIVDLLLIRGQWSTNIMSQTLSESFHELLATSDALIGFDDALAEDGELGGKLKSAMVKSDRNKEEVKYVRQILKDINEKAQAFINTSAQNLITIGKNVKALVEDHDKSPHELIINWKELEAAGGDMVKTKLIAIYKQIYFFVQLMQYFVKSNQE